MDPIKEIINRLSIIENKVIAIENIHLGTKEIEMVSRAKILKVYHNKNMNTLMALNIDLRMFEGMKDDEVVAVEQTEGVQVQGYQTMKKITVKQQREKYLKLKETIKRGLAATEELLIEEGIELDPKVRAN